MDTKSVQIGGDHYKNMSIQPIEYILSNGLGFCEGNVVKYVSRWKDKGGAEDLKKARHYLDMLIEQSEVILIDSADHASISGWPDGYEWWARDSDGECHYYETEPRWFYEKSCWIANDGGCIEDYKSITAINMPMMIRRSVPRC